MSDPTNEPTRGRVLLLETNAPLRSAITTVLAAEGFEVQRVDSLDEALSRAMADGQTVALVAWQSMEGLLADEHRRHLADLTRRMRLVVMVPRRWARLLEMTDLSSCGVALVAKPFEADELISHVEIALSQPTAQSALTH
jgi:DNA-binding response OmpR family regulator